ncbi:hypothetical protein, partial [Frankia sp. AvcI1]
AQVPQVPQVPVFHTVDVTATMELLDQLRELPEFAELRSPCGYGGRSVEVDRVVGVVRAVRFRQRGEIKEAAAAVAELCGEFGRVRGNQRCSNGWRSSTRHYSSGLPRSRWRCPRRS